MRSKRRQPATAQSSHYAAAGFMVGVGLLCGILLLTVLGGVTHTGATTNSGWLALIVALMCLPFGGLLLTLGVAKWLRNRRLQRQK